ncbi:hydroxylamine reductase [Alloprevotella sp. Lung230]|uniref:hydroxylamine reductase n=1 Tax=Alloprevotella sp. Lung230 TaxID=2766595 RepID=UPI001656570C|nr:hydroxylamine reductase [Alloprevotella sp. Lung230]MBC8626178.1 hydroxylamine reductase [Alloprevotella sp. Lung230]
MDAQMFCFQCQETAKNQGCLIKGVCGKLPSTARLQDLLLFVVRGISVAERLLRQNGINVEREIYVFNTDALFCTITNANFDDDSIAARVEKGLQLRDRLKALLIQHDINVPQVDALTWSDVRENFDAKAGEVGVLAEKDEDKRSLTELIIYGLKGLAAYVEHAERLGYEDLDINRFMCDALAALTVDHLDVEALIALTLRTGEFGVKGMEILDRANTGSYGHPEITEVSIDVRSNPGILISGHDLKDLEMLLEQTEGTGVDIYTHGEMLPAHYYPAFKKYKHFVGNYGNAWWQQRAEFTSFNGPILFTTNCIVPPLSNASYKDKVFTTNATGYPGWKHVTTGADGKKDFSEIIALAKTCPAPTSIEKGSIVGGFAHNQVFALADKVVDAVKSGAIKKFVVMSGCDGRQAGRDYYADFAKALPQDTVILTSGCAKYRYNKLALGDINGIPRVLDAGQCNDSYSLALIALKLKEVFGLDNVNDLPIVYNIAWYEQKAIIVLLGLLYLGVKNIHVGPTLPGFLSPNVTKVLVDNFGIAGITDVENDMKLFGIA